MPPILQIKQDISYALRKLTSKKKKKVFLSDPTVIQYPNKTQIAFCSV